MLVVSDTSAEDGAAHSLYLLQRWFPLILQVSGVNVRVHVLQALRQGGQRCAESRAG